MKLKSLLSVSIVLALFSNSFAQQNLVEFWAKFKNAVIKGDKNAVANMTQFPLSMPFGMKQIKTKSVFLKKYNVIFNGEADAAKCFSKSKIEKTEDNRYIIACGFKKSSDEQNNPIEYEFVLGKSGWKFTSFDNINE
jgi:hypothetical protein